MSREWFWKAALCKSQYSVLDKESIDMMKYDDHQL